MMNRSAQHQAALNLVAAGFRVFPLAPGTKTPPKGHHGWKEATSDPNQVNQWFATSPYLNVGLDLFHAGLMVVDIDTASQTNNGQAVHKGASGAKSLLAYLKAHNHIWPANSYTEQTPHSGHHAFFRLPQVLDKPIRKTGVQSGIPGVDLLGDFVIVAPSVVDGRSYQINGPTTDLGNALVAPTWLVDLLVTAPERQRLPMGRMPQNSSKRWTGKFFDEIANGAHEGHRNSWLSSITGKILRVGTDPGAAYELIQVINQNFISPPLPDSEVNAVFNSVAKYHR